MFKIHKGTTRRAIVLGHVVIKIPRFFPILFRKESNYRKRTLPWQGLVGNITECGTSNCFHSEMPFLTRVYFCAIIFTIQKFEKGRHPTREEIRVLINKLSPKARTQADYVEPHCFQPSNFIINDSGWHVIDYGDRFLGQYMSFSNFLFRNREELMPLFAPIK